MLIINKKLQLKLYYLNELDNMIFTYEFIKIRLTNLVFVIASKKKKKMWYCYKLYIIYTIKLTIYILNKLNTNLPFY